MCVSRDCRRRFVALAATHRAHHHHLLTLCCATQIVRVGAVLAVGSAVYQFLTNLHTVPITGRTQVVVLTQEEECVRTGRSILSGRLYADLYGRMTGNGHLGRQGGSGRLGRDHLGPWLPHVCGRRRVRCVLVCWFGG